MTTIRNTSRAARGGGGSFKNRKRIGEIGIPPALTAKRLICSSVSVRLFTVRELRGLTVHRKGTEQQERKGTEQSTGREQERNRAEQSTGKSTGKEQSSTGKRRKQSTRKERNRAERGKDRKETEQSRAQESAQERKGRAQERKGEQKKGAERKQSSGREHRKKEPKLSFWMVFESFWGWPWSRIQGPFGLVGRACAQ